MDMDRRSFGKPEKPITFICPWPAERPDVYSQAGVNW